MNSENMVNFVTQILSFEMKQLNLTPGKEDTEMTSSESESSISGGSNADKIIN